MIGKSTIRTTIQNVLNDGGSEDHSTLPLLHQGLENFKSRVRSLNLLLGECVAEARALTPSLKQFMDQNSVTSQEMRMAGCEILSIEKKNLAEHERSVLLQLESFVSGIAAEGVAVAATAAATTAATTAAAAAAAASVPDVSASSSSMSVSSASSRVDVVLPLKKKRAKNRENSKAQGGRGKRRRKETKKAVVVEEVVEEVVAEVVRGVHMQRTEITNRRKKNLSLIDTPVQVDEDEEDDEEEEEEEDENSQPELTGSMSQKSRMSLLNIDLTDVSNSQGTNDEEEIKV